MSTLLASVADLAAPGSRLLFDFLHTGDTPAAAAQAGPCLAAAPSWPAAQHGVACWTVPQTWPPLDWPLLCLAAPTLPTCAAPPGRCPGWQHALRGILRLRRGGLAPSLAQAHVPCSKGLRQDRLRLAERRVRRSSGSERSKTLPAVPLPEPRHPHPRLGLGWVGLTPLGCWCADNPWPPVLVPECLVLEGFCLVCPHRAWRARGRPSSLGWCPTVMTWPPIWRHSTGSWAGALGSRRFFQPASAGVRIAGEPPSVHRRLFDDDWLDQLVLALC